MRLDRNELEELLYGLELTRRTEEALSALHEREEISSPLTLRRGLEALGVGAASALEENDSLGSSIPSVGPWLTRGTSVERLIAQLRGSPTADGSGHDALRGLGDAGRGVVAATGHAATHLGVLAGTAFAHRVRREARVAMALVTSDALATGDFHEGLNFAVVQRCPLVVVVVRDTTAGSEAADVVETAEGYGVPGVPVDGRDVLEVVQIVSAAVSRARTGHGPALIDAAVGPCERYPCFPDAIPAPFTPATDPGPGEAGPDADPLRRFAGTLASNDWVPAAARKEAIARASRDVGAAIEATSRAASTEAPPERVGGRVFAS